MDTYPIPSLTVDRFFGIDKLEVPLMGQLNLFACEQARGKTSILEALWFLAQSGDLGVLTSALAMREALTPGDWATGHLDFETLFTYGGEPKLTIRTAADSLPAVSAELDADADTGEPLMVVRCGDKERQFDLVRNRNGAHGTASDITARSMEWPEPLHGAYVPDVCHARTSDMAGLWGNVALTDAESLAQEILAITENVDFDLPCAFVSGGETRTGIPIIRSGGERRAVASFGSTAMRLLHIGIGAAAAAGGGVLLVDGIDKSLSAAELERLLGVLSAKSQIHDFQVFATVSSNYGKITSIVSDLDCTGTTFILTRRERDGEALRAYAFGYANV